MTTIEEFLIQLKLDKIGLVEIKKPSRSAESIRESFLNKNTTPEDKAVTNYGSKGLRAHYNRPYLRKRTLLESGHKIKFQTHNIRFIPSVA